METDITSSKTLQNTIVTGYIYDTICFPFQWEYKHRRIKVQSQLAYKQGLIMIYLAKAFDWLGQAVTPGKPLSFSSQILTL